MTAPLPASRSELAALLEIARRGAVAKGTVISLDVVHAEQIIAELNAPLSERGAVVEECAKVCDQMMPVGDSTGHLKLQRETLENAARSIRALRYERKDS